MEELNLGKKLQAIRTSKKISVRKLAAMTNLTASMISQIENGAVNPSIPTLRTISSALETPIYYFFKDEDNASVVVTQSTRMVLGNKQEPSVVYELLTPDTRGEIEFCMMVIPPKAYSCREPKGPLRRRGCLLLLRRGSPARDRRRQLYAAPRGQHPHPRRGHAPMV